MLGSSPPSLRTRANPLEMPKEPSFVRPLAPGVALLALAGAAAAQTVRLSGPLAQPRIGDVQDFALSPDGTRAVYRADVQRAGQYELFSTALDGSQPAVRLHAPTTLARRQVLSFAIGAGERVAFVGDLNDDNVFQLFGAPLTGTASPLELSGTITGVEELLLTPDGTRVVFRDGQFVYAVPLDGSAAPLALAPLPASNHARLRITSDSTRLVFTRTIGDLDYLGRVALDGSLAPLLLANSGTPSATATYFGAVTLGADGVHGAYVPVDPLAGGITLAGLYGFTVDRSHGPVRLHLSETQDGLPPHAVAGERVLYTEPDGTLYTLRTDGSGRVALAPDVAEFTLSPDGASVAFVRGAAPASELCLAPADGSAPELVLAGPGTFAHVRFAPDAGLVYFLSTDPVDAFRGLFAVPATGGTPQLLNGPAVPGGLGAVDFAVAPVGERVVYREERAADELLELWSVGPDRVPQRLSGPLAGFRDVFAYAFASDGATVAYLADQESDQTQELFAAPSDGSLPAKRLGEPFPVGPVAGDVSAFQATRDGRFIVYSADQEVDEFRDLYAVRTGSVRPPVRLSAPVQDDFDVHSDVTLLSERELVVAEYRADASSSAPFAHLLLCAALAGDTPARILDRSPALDGVTDVFSALLVAPDESFLVYEARVAAGRELRRVPVDGSEAPLTLLALPADRSVSAARLTPDGLAVVLLANVATPDSVELFRVEGDGSAPPLRLHPALVNGRDVGDFAFSANGSRVVFRASLDRVAADLYSVPSDGSAAPRRLNSGLGNGVGVEDFLALPGSAEFVYHSSGDAFFRVPADGSSAAQFLIDLPDGSLQPGFQLGPDGAHLFYRRESLGEDIVELFALSTSGGAPVKLSGAMTTGGEVTAFAPSPAGTRIVYLADQRADERFELFSATLASPGQPLWPSPLAGSDVTDFQLDRESRFAVFLLRSGSLAAGLDALYRVPLDASAPPELIHRPLDPDGDVKSDFLTLPRGRVVYRADATDEVLELFQFQPRPVQRR